MLITNVEAMIKDIATRFKISLFLLEQQIGKFAAKQIEFVIFSAIIHQGDYKIDTQTPKCKLSIKYDQEFAAKKDTKKYNQNKNEAVAHAKKFLEMTKQDKDHSVLTRDEADSLL